MLCWKRTKEVCRLERRAAQIYKNKETEETSMDDMNMEITTSEHRAFVFKMNRKQAAAVARYLKEHSASPETILRPSMWIRWS